MQNPQQNLKEIFRLRLKMTRRKEIQSKQRVASLENKRSDVSLENDEVKEAKNDNTKADSTFNTS
ncbi:hypothetical protein [Helicobacter labetoulli]|uniref:hypothetical protein n=1 Tax=Helicobacter labetoulli TaxID=2315333 RepID=UPI00142E1D6A|nr:hypothetical protein [Helicobacter labetoulli]